MMMMVHGKGLAMTQRSQGRLSSSTVSFGTTTVEEDCPVTAGSYEDDGGSGRLSLPSRSVTSISSNSPFVMLHSDLSSLTVHRAAMSMSQDLRGKLVCAMVGLPARGKTYISQKLARYLNWLGIPTHVFNVGQYRRKISGATKRHDFFDPSNAEAEEERMRAATEAMDEMLAWLRDTEGQIAIYDATNTSLRRREMIRNTCERLGVALLFIESVCDREDIIVDNITQVKLSSPDYVGMDPGEAVSDFCARIHHYEQVYEPVGTTSEEQLVSYVKLINIGAKAVINRIMDYRQSKIVFYLMNLHIKPRSIYLCRHGETQHNLAGRIGGNADLSERGQIFAQRLPELLHKQLGDIPLSVWTSTLKRTIQTVKHLPYPKTSWKALDEIDAGVCEELTYEEISVSHPLNRFLINS